jgi:transcriptional regulator with XRE-family HTH domain
MKLGTVLRKERERRRIEVEHLSDALGLSVDEYRELEGGESPVETWGGRLGQFAIKLSTPTSRLISRTGKAEQARQEEGQCGKLIRQRREERGLSRQQLAEQLDLSVEELASIEEGASLIETYAPLLLRFAEVVEQPIFNLFYPCGLPLDKLDDYP